MLIRLEMQGPLDNNNLIEKPVIWPKPDIECLNDINIFNSARILMELSKIFCRVIRIIVKEIA